MRHPCLCAMLSLLWPMAAGSQTTNKPVFVPSAVAPLMATYRTNASVEARIQALRSLEKYRVPAVERFLLDEYTKLDSGKEPDAQLLGGFLRIWAARPAPAVMPFLIYEGLFHDDADVVRACAAGIAEDPAAAMATMSTGRDSRGKDPAEDLMADLIERMEERPDVLPALESVLALWSGKTRPGFSRNLKRKADKKETAAALEFWKAWFQQRFKKGAGKK